MDLFIFRHGETYESLKKLDYTADNVFSAELLPIAKPKIERVANFLKDKETEFNVSSPFPRCLQTVEIISNMTGKIFSTDERLGEYVFQKGETFEQMATRVKNFVDELIQKNYLSVAICTHGGIIAGIKHYLIDGNYQLKDLHDYPRPGVITIIKDNKIEYVDFSETA